MDVFDLPDEQGVLRAFEIENSGVGRSGVCRVVRSIPGATIERTPRFLSWFREDSFCEFTFQGVRFLAEEPYGDSSRYWIGPIPPRSVDQTQEIRADPDHPELRLVPMWSHLAWTIAAFLLGIGLFRFIGRFPVVDRRTKLLLVAALLIAAVPTVRLALAFHGCEDSGGSWYAGHLRCSHE